MILSKAKSGSSAWQSHFWQCGTLQLETRSSPHDASGSNLGFDWAASFQRNCSAHGCLFHPSWLLWSHYFWWTFEAAGGVLSVMSQPPNQSCHTLQRVDLARPFLVSPAIKTELKTASEWPCPKRKAAARGNPIFGSVEPCNSRHEALRMMQVDQSWALIEHQAFNATGENHFWESKKLMCLRPENEIAAVTFFAKTSTALTNRSALASPTEWQDPGEHRCWFKVSSPPAGCRSLPKHHVVWNCLGVVGSEMYIDFCGFVLCWYFLFVCFVLVGLLLVGVCFLVWFIGGDFITAFWPVTVHFWWPCVCANYSCSRKCI